MMYLKELFYLVGALPICKEGGKEGSKSLFSREGREEKKGSQRTSKTAFFFLLLSYYSSTIRPNKEITTPSL